MKYLSLPVHLFKFWYPEALVIFIRSWQNIIAFLEEDLAVTLMVKLFWMPLFHDSTIVGRILSVIFRSSRIILGVFAYLLATVLIFLVAIAWFTMPLWAPWFLKGWGLILLGSGVGLFAIHILTHPHKKVWQIKDPKNLWSCSKVKPSNLNLEKLLESSEVQNILKYLEITEEDLNVILGRSGATTPESNVDSGQARMTNLVQPAFELAKKMSSPYIEEGHFLIAMIESVPAVEEKLLKFNLEVKDFILTLTYLEKKWLKWRVASFWDDDFAIHHLKGINRGWLGVPTPSLDSVSKDLTEIAAKVGFPDFLGRDSNVSQIINILSQEKGRNVVIVAPAGSGKSALINSLAKRIIAGDAPAALAIKRIVELDLTSLMADIKTQGDLAERVKLIFDEAAYSQNVILVVEEIHDLGIGEAGILFNLYSMLVPYIESSNIQFIGTTEPENYTHILEKNSAFARLFTKIDLPPATPAETLQILEDRAIEVEKRKKLRVTYKAIKKIVELSDKLIHGKVLPDSALAILEQSEVSGKDGWVSSKTVEDVVSQMVDMPVTEADSDQKQRLLNLEDEIHGRLIDQEEAVKAVSDNLRRSATGLREEKRPIGSFLFVGPTGVGKTELAKILADIYFNKNNRGLTSARGETSVNSGTFLRFDMSEYQTTEAVNRLIGFPGEGGQLTDAVRNKPYCLLLLDEFEKADPRILTLFLQVLEDGRLTDGAGRRVDFTNTIIIATSNAASLTIVNGLKSGKTLAELEESISQELLQTFKPELVNRFDRVILFKPLLEADLQKVVLLKLQDLKNELKEKGYQVEFSDELISELAKKGYDPVLGARPLRRLIQDTLEANLSKLILEDKLEKGKAFKVGVEIMERS